MMIALIDYGVGNLFSLSCSLSAVGADVLVTSDGEQIKNADKLILPGVGAFGDAAKKLTESGIGDTVIKCAKSGVPVLGICLGMQLLFDKSFEFGEHSGLSLIPGVIKPLSGYIDSGLKIPHIGYNSLDFKNSTPLFKYINNGDYVYFVHSYYAECDGKYVTADTEYGARVTAAVQKDNIFGCQFHPEKSGKVGLHILKAFTEL